MLFEPLNAICRSLNLRGRLEMTGNKTQGVRDLVEEVVAGLPSSERNEHVIRNVFRAIEQRPEWRRRYDLECGVLKQWVVNNWVGKWTRDRIGHTGTKRQVPMEGLATSYSVLE